MLSLTNLGAMVAIHESETKPSTTYSAIAQMYLPSLVGAETEELKQLQIIREKNEKILFENRGNIIFPAVGEVEKLRLIYQLFDADDIKYGNLLDSKRSVLSAVTPRDIELYCGPAEKPEYSLFSRLDRTITSFGKIRLQNLLYPTFNENKDLKTQINQRIGIIKFLTTHPGICMKIKDHLKVIRANENELVWFWKQMNDITKSHFDSIYSGFGGHENIYIQGASAEWRRFMQPFCTFMFYPQFLFSAVVAMAIAFYAEYSMPHSKASISFNDICGYVKKDFFDHLWTHFFYGHPLINLIKAECISYIPGNPNYDASKSQFQIFAMVMILTGLIILTPICGYKAYKDLTSLNKITNEIQAKLIGVASVFNSFAEIENIIRSNPTLAALLPSFNKPCKDPNPDFDELLEAFTKNTFKGQPSFWSNKARIMTCFKKLLRLKNESDCISKLKAIGEVDAFLSVSQFYGEHATRTDTPVCFVELVESDKPYIKMQKVWHLKLDKPVAHNFELGTSEAGHNIILTGPNACGKSVYLRELVVALLLAISFGITTAASCKFTLLIKIATYLNIADTIGKESLFQAELQRAKELLDHDSKLKPGEYMFVVIDEPFTGTNPEEAMLAVSDLIKGFSSQTICVLSSHFKELTNLEVETNGYFRNFKVYVDITPDGKLKRTYEVVPGISDQRIATIMAQQTLGQYFANKNAVIAR